MAMKNYNKRNTSINKEALNIAKNNFEQLRKKECQNFILKKTENLNVTQTRMFWKQFGKMFKPKKPNKVEPLKQSDGSIITECDKIEEVLFSTFFCGQHLDEKGGDFDDQFYQEVNALYSSITNNKGFQHQKHL